MDSPVWEWKWGHFLWELRWVLWSSHEYPSRDMTICANPLCIARSVFEKTNVDKGPLSYIKKNKFIEIHFSPCFVIQYLFILRLVHSLWASVLMYWIFFSSIFFLPSCLHSMENCRKSVNVKLCLKCFNLSHIEKIVTLLVGILSKPLFLA